jgi:C1A family cysteine protease
VTARHKANFGWLPDLPDGRDHLYGPVRGPRSRLPRSVDLRGGCSPVEYQGRLGSCTANALAGALEFLERKEGDSSVNTSRLFIYYNERLLRNNVRQDCGAMMRDGIKTLAKQGVCSETLWPYVMRKFARKPTAACYLQALTRRISRYARLRTLREMRTCLADGYPFVLGFSLYESFASARVARTGVVALPKPDERLTSGHALMAVGYDDRKKVFIMRNSWGRAWGMQGYCTLPYAYLADRNLSDDFWTLRRGAAL